MKKSKNSGWDNPKWPKSRSKKRKISNTPTKLYERSDIQKGANIKFGTSKDKYQKVEYHDSRAYSENIAPEHNGKITSSDIYHARKEEAKNRYYYPAACNLTKKDLFEEYPDATIICTTCGYMLEGDTPTIFIDCNRCTANEVEIKMMREI